LEDAGVVRFEITYTDDEGVEQKQMASFVDTESITAREWAEDYAYNLADKGPYEIKEVKQL
jgi:hypothetical protein